MRFWPTASFTGHMRGAIQPITSTCAAQHTAPPSTSRSPGFRAGRPVTLNRYMPTTAAQLQAVLWELAFAGPLAIGLAFFLQILAQRDAPPAHTAILLSMEAVFGAIAGAALLQERLTGIMLLGCAVVLVAMLVAQRKPPVQMTTAD